MSEAERLALISFINENMRYQDGDFFWTNASRMKGIGTKVGTPDKRGYIRTEIKHRKYAVHKLIYLIHYGIFPELIDHIDGNIANNRIENLRECTLSQNQFNTKIRKDSKSGVKGVYFTNNAWISAIRANGKYWSKRHKTLELATLAIEDMRAKLHGEFARSL